MYEGLVRRNCVEVGRRDAVPEIADDTLAANALPMSGRDRNVTLTWEKQSE